MKTWIVGLALIAFLALTPTAAPAHEGHDHKVMGTISSIQGNNLMVKATDGKTVMVMLTPRRRSRGARRRSSSPRSKSATASSRKDLRTRA